MSEDSVAGVGEYEHVVVAVGGFPDGGEDHAAGADAGEDQSGEVSIVELLVEIGGGKRPDACFADDDVVGVGRDVIVYGGF